jgi:hypothetical protein
LARRAQSVDRQSYPKVRDCQRLLTICIPSAFHNVFNPPDDHFHSDTLGHAASHFCSRLQAILATAFKPRQRPETCHATRVSKPRLTPNSNFWCCAFLTVVMARLPKDILNRSVGADI